MCARLKYQSTNQIDPNEVHFFGSQWFLILLALILLQTVAQDWSLLEQIKSRRKERKGIVYYFFPIHVPPSNKEICSYMGDLGAAAEQE